MKLIVKNGIHFVYLETNLSKESIFVIDTTFPNSFCLSKDIKYVLINSYKESLFIKSITYFRNMINDFGDYDVAGFIGLDLLKKYGLTIDYQNSTIDFSVKKGYPLSLMKWDEGIPFINYLLINNKTTNRILIDTISNRSYFSSKYLNDNDRINKKFDDFNFIYGSIKGDIYSVSLKKDPFIENSYGHNIEAGILNNDINAFKIDGLIKPEDLLKNEEKLSPNKIISFDFNSKAVYID